MDLVDASSGQIRLRRTIAQYLTLETAEETQFVSAAPGQWGYGQRQMLVWPYHHVTHVLLDEGHLWGHKRVAIPIGVVADVEHGVRLTLDKDQVRDLPPVDLDDQ
jgi:hypothetical protein